ncbi:MAG TPA: glycosyltransferase family 39 protein [Dysgonomonas sp.]|uniref:ArnT family glycosyltransferase n=1 Tax=unclassified Dysgonomonas TaxID=2630389 RepID=UPI0025C274BF|nr:MULTISPECIES: glycosyltransferase family 39 protein [unclassified Dysgonomonas]HML65189.1 glycosyltransferase family 39 protein [Dysgonomonas sp.]
MKSWHYLLIFLSLIPIILLRDFTPDNELRYISIVNEAITNGNFFHFTNHGNIYADKPPLYFWIIMLGKWLLGEHQVWFLSLFSILPAFIILYLMNKWTKDEMDDRYRTVTSLMLMTSTFFLGGTLVLRMDMLMSMFILLALYTFYRMYKKTANKYDGWLFPFYIFMAVFTKGPMGILIPLFSTIVFLILKKEFRTIGKYWGWKTCGFLAVTFGSWFLLVWLEGGNAYLNDLLFNQTVNRAIDSFHHEKPFYYYIITVWYSLAPWSLLFFAVILTGMCRKMIKTDLEVFFATVILVTFVMLSVISSKIEIYMLPVFPFIAYLTGILLYKIKWSKWATLAITIPSVVLTIAPLLLNKIPMDNFVQIENTSIVYAVPILLTISGIAALYFLYGRKDKYKSIYILSFSILIALFILGLAIPSFNNEIGYRELCMKGIELKKKESGAQYYMYKIRRGENMDVYLHEQVVPVSVDDIVSSKYAGSVLFINNKWIEKDNRLNSFLRNKQRIKVGKNSAIKL